MFVYKEKIQTTNNNIIKKISETYNINLNINT